MISGKDFMLYFEYDTGDGIINIPYCAASSVTLNTKSDLREVTKPRDSKWSFYEYGKLNYTLSIEALVKYSLQEIQRLILDSTSGLIITNGGQKIQVGENVLPPDDFGYYEFEYKLMNWLPVKWMMKDIVNEFITYKGECLISQTNQTIVPDDFIKGSIDMQGQGAYEVLSLPIPTNLKYLGKENAPTETATITESGSSDRITGQSWTQRFVSFGIYLPGGVFSVSIYSDSLTHTVKPGELIEDIIDDLATQINNKSYVPSNPPPAIITAVKDADEALVITFDFQHSAGASYSNTTLSVKNASFSFDTETGFAGYTFKVINNTDNETYYINAISKLPSFPLVTGKSYTVSVMGYNNSGLMSDYSEPLNINF